VRTGSVPLVMMFSVVGMVDIITIMKAKHEIRYVKGHMKKHNDESGHPIALSFSDLSIWCYKCEDYVSQVCCHV
jgi:hypothetical protein